MSPTEARAGRTAVLDASALLALLQGEPGGEVVEQSLESAAISSVNWSEVVQKTLDRRLDASSLRQDLEALGLVIVPFSALQAERAAGLRQQTRALGLSLGDRACLALALELALPAFTVDRAWSELDVGVAIRVVR